MKMVPYGTANYEKIVEYDHYYVDKTRYIAALENLGTYHHFFLRPRRFGKSLTLSVLEHYYDPNRADRFQELFGNTWIGRNPTPRQGKLPVLKMNFSGIAIEGSEREIRDAFSLKVRDDIRSFYRRYSATLGFPDTFDVDFAGMHVAGNVLNRFFARMRDYGVSYYLLIDEYDNLATNILIHHGRESYLGLTHTGGFLRSFFAAIKNATEERTVERLFVTGVSPLVLSDVTSGMNIGDNISAMPPFGAMAGFTHDEVEAMLDYYIEVGMVPQYERDRVVEIMRVNYNNYCFTENTSERMYNPDMVLYFFHTYEQLKKTPTSLLDENARTDYGKLRYLIVESKKLNGNFDILARIVDGQEVEAELTHAFALEDMVVADRFTSFLHYLGLLTIREFVYANKCVLTIPNEVVRKMHFDYIRRSLGEGFDLKIDVDYLRNEFDRLAFRGEWRPLIEYILNAFYEASSIRDFVFREQGIKSFLLAYLNVTPLYFVESEPEMNRGFADIFLRKNAFTTDLTKHEYLIEVKYVTREEEKRPDAIARAKAAAAEQLERYAQSRRITCRLHRIVIVATATEATWEALGESDAPGTTR